MNPPLFDAFFEKATGNTPYDYQRRLACGEQGDEKWLSGGTNCNSRLINIPTGLGKTAAVVLAWLWNRIGVQIQNPKSEIQNQEEWPRRLVYCLPMRTLVEQTQEEVRKWLDNLLQKADEIGITVQQLEDLKWLAEHSPIILMGGEENDELRRDWDIQTEKPSIHIGTQDMLLNRAFNRGYGTGLLKRVAADLAANSILGCSRQMLNRMRQFYITYSQLAQEICSPAVSKLGGDLASDEKCSPAVSLFKSSLLQIENWLSEGAPCESRLINIPTGRGKTAAVILAWLWNRIGAQIGNPKYRVAPPPGLLFPEAEAVGAMALPRHLRHFKVI